MHIHDLSTMTDIKIKYFTDKIKKLAYIGGSKKSNWIDLSAAEDVCAFQFDAKAKAGLKSMNEKAYVP